MGMLREIWASISLERDALHSLNSVRVTHAYDWYVESDEVGDFNDRRSQIYEIHLRRRGGKSSSQSWPRVCCHIKQASHISGISSFYLPCHPGCHTITAGYVTHADSQGHNPRSTRSSLVFHVNVIFLVE